MNFLIHKYDYDYDEHDNHCDRTTIQPRVLPSKDEVLYYVLCFMT